MSSGIVVTDNVYVPASKLDTVILFPLTLTVALVWFMISAVIPVAPVNVVVVVPWVL